MFGLKVFVQVQTFRRGPPRAPAQLLPPWSGSGFHDGVKLTTRMNLRVYRSLENIWFGRILYFDNLFPFFMATYSETDPDIDTDNSIVACSSF